ncbi:MAG: hypothetical protein H0T51_17325 [Pirellulales bacterium]|nr:hypothetical protein [Pirellulales bacterium]
MYLKSWSFTLITALHFAGVSFLTCLPSAHAQTAFFRGLGVAADIGGMDVSDDGSIIFASLAGKVHRWTKDTGLVDLGLNRGASTYNLFASGDGSTFFASTFGTGYRWNEQAGLEPLSGVVQITDASTDGLTAVGMHANGAYRWTKQSGFTFLNLSSVSGAGHYPWGVSGDGLVVAGRVGPGNYQTWRWSEVTGAIALPTPSGYVGSNTNPAISYDGSVIGGLLLYVQGDLINEESARWTAATGWIGLGRPENFQYSGPRGISDDGSRILFTASGRDGNPSLSASFLWDDQKGTKKRSGNGKPVFSEVN